MKTTFADRCIIYSVVVSLLSPPSVWAGQSIEIAAGRQASLDSAQNGVPVVNISAPNSKGVSHNQYTKFNIDTQGLILNNGLAASATQLGGNINANPNLLGAAARIILNEVVSTDASQLNGLAEIAGQSAEFILANPNGISCSGCGFINTPRAILTTGVPNLLDGDVSGFSVDKGEIAIDHLNASTIDRLDLLARAITVNENLHAQSLNIVTGRNDIDHSDLSATEKVDDGSLKPDFALDVAALGGMYANQIVMVGTEAGLGVNMQGELASSSGDIVLQADGSLIINKVVSGSNLQLHSDQGDIQIEGVSYSLGATRLIALQGDITNNGNLIAESALTIEAGNLNNQVMASIQSFGLTDIQLSGDLNNLTDGSDQGAITSDGAFTITANNVFNQGILGGGDTLTINAADMLENSSEFGEVDAVLFAVGDLNLYGQTVINRQSQIFGLEDITIAGDGSGSAAQSFHNISGTVESFNDLNITANEFLNTRDGVYQMDNSAYCSSFENFCGIQPNDAEWVGMAEGTTAGDFWLLPESIDYVEWWWATGGDWNNPSQFMLDTYQALLDTFMPSTRDAMIMTGRDLNVLAGDFRNEGGYISVGNDLTANVTRFVNMSTGSAVAGRGDWGIEWEDWIQELDYEIFFGDFQLAFIYNEAYITADNNLIINATNEISNGFEDEGYSDEVALPDLPLPKSPDSGQAETLIVDQLQLAQNNPFDSWLDLPPGADFEQVDIEITLPPSNGTGGLFTYTDPKSGNTNTLIATNASVARYVNVLGSDYLLELLGADPDATTKRLGDGFYESRLIRKAIMDATGSRFLYDEFTSDAQQYRYLMESAAKAQEDLQLTLGVALTAEQIQSLSHDMVWLEEREVNGETVLVPTLYLAGARHDDFDRDGAILSARNVQLNSGGNIVNAAGIAAKENLVLHAQNSIQNRGAALEANNVAITTESGDFIHQNKGQAKAYLIADNQLQIDSGRDIEIQGSEIHAGSAAQIYAGRDMNVTSTLAESDYAAEYFWGEKDGVTSRTVTKERRHQAQINIAGDTTINTGRDLNLAGAEINIEGNAALGVGRDLDLASVTNKTTTETRELYTTHYQKTEGGKLVRANVVGKDSKALEKEKSITQVTDFQQQGSALNVGGGLDLEAGNNVNLSASDIRVEGSSNVLLGGGLTLSAVNHQQEVQRTTTKHYRRTPVKLAVKQSKNNQLGENGLGRSQQIHGVGTAQKQSYTNNTAVNGSGVIVLDANPYFSEVEKQNSEKVTGVKTANFTTQGDTQIYAKGNIRNTQASQISGAETLLAASGNIDNTDGSKIKGEDVLLNAGQSINNTGGSVIKGSKIALIAVNDINNQRDVEQTIQRNGDFISTQVSDASRVESDADLLLQAGRDINNLGSIIEAGGSAELLAGRDINIKAIADRERRADNKDDIIDDTRHIKATLAAADDLGLQADNNIHVFGSSISTEGDLKLSANQAINIESATDKHYRFIHEEDKGTFSSKSETTEIYKTINIASDIVAEGDIDIRAKNEDFTLKGSSLSSGGDITVEAGGKVAIEAAQEIYDYRHEESKSSFGGLSISGLLESKKSSEETIYKESYVGANSKSAGDTAIVSDGDINIVASHVEAGDDINIDSRAGHIALLSEKEIDSFSSHQHKSGAIKQTIQGEGHYHEMVKHAELMAGGELTLTAANGVLADFQMEEGESLQQSVTRLSQVGPELQWMQQLLERDDVNWQAVQEIHETWEYKQSGLSQVGALILAVIISIVTAGAGASLLQAAGVEAASTAVVASANAAVNTLATQAATSFINNNGDVGAVFDDLGSSDSVKALLVSAASAGVGLNNRGAEAYGGKEVAVMAASSIDKDLGALLSFGLDNWSDPTEAIAQNFVGEAMQYAIRNEVAKQAEHMGLTSEELNLILMVNSFVGREVAGTTYRPPSNDGKYIGSIQGFFSRDGDTFGELTSIVGGIWDVNDSILNAQGHLDAIAQQAIADGPHEELIGHSLGSWRTNNLARKGWVGKAILEALPVFDHPVHGSDTYCATKDGVCGESL